MPSTPRHTSIWNTTTTIIVIRGNFNNVQGDLRHLDRSTTFTSTASTASGPFNVEPESTVTRQSPQPTIMVVGGNFNNVQGNFRHLDRSTTTSTASTDPFNVEPASESTVTPQSSLSTTSPAPVPPAFPVPTNPSAKHPDHDTNRPSSITEVPYQTADAAVSESAQNKTETSPIHDEHSESSLHPSQSSTEASKRQLSQSRPRQSKSDERGTIGKNSLIKTNKFKAVRTKIKERLKRAFRHG